eukprot:Opistho-2@21031
MRKVLGEVSGLNRLDRSRRQRCGILGEGGVVVEGGPVRETLGPRKDRRQRVEADVRIPLGICRKVAGESPVTSLRHDNLAIARDKGARHESNRTKTSSHGARLDIAVIVLARPHKSAVRLDCICNHVVNQAVLVPDLHLVKLALVALVVDCLEDVLEASVILLKDCVLAAEVQRLLALNGGIEARVRECLNRRVRVVHSNGNTRLLKLKHVSARLLAVCGGECDLEVAGTGCEKVRSIKLVARRLPDDCDWVGPRGNGGMDVLRTNLFADNDTTNDTPDGCIGTPQFTRLVGSRRGALDGGTDFLNGGSGIFGDLVLCAQAILEGEVEGALLHIDMGIDELLGHEVPQSSSNAISFDLNNGVRNRNLGGILAL